MRTHHLSKRFHPRTHRVAKKHIKVETFHDPMIVEPSQAAVGSGLKPVNNLINALSSISLKRKKQSRRKYIF